MAVAWGLSGTGEYFVQLAVLAWGLGGTGEYFVWL